MAEVLQKVYSRHNVTKVVLQKISLVGMYIYKSSKTTTIFLAEILGIIVTILAIFNSIKLTFCTNNADND